jgi:mannose-1-phosphate guanylyltransferase
MYGSPARTMRVERAPVRGARHGSQRDHTWAVLLAGGEGKRLLGASVDGERIDRPKQFCRFGRDDSLLGSTLWRARRIADPARILPVVSEQHRTWWRQELQHLPEENVLVQPQARGTAVALLHALVHILLRDDDAMIVVLPCDHGVDDDDPLLGAVDRAVAAAAEPSGPLVLIGVEPGWPETQYGWIVPRSGGASPARPVRRFDEKPSLRDACVLMEQGGLWNSLIFAVSGHGLLERFLEATPRLVEAYLWKRPVSPWSPEALLECFASLPFADLSHDILERSVPHLRVVPVRDSGWTDLGTPHRLETWLHRQRRRASPAREGPTLRLLTP